MRTGIPVLCGMERISYFRSIVGAGASIFRWQWSPDQVQTWPSSMNTPAVIELPLSTFENMNMEQMWRLDDCLNQARRAWKSFKWYKNYVVTVDFPETSFSSLLQFTCQNIQIIHLWNVELLWLLPIFPRWIPPPHPYQTLLTSPWPRNELCSFNCVFLIPSFDRLTTKLLVPLS